VSVLRLYGKITRQGKIKREAMVEKEDRNISYHDMLEECLIELCKKLDIPVPLWLKKNTTEFVNYRKTFFSNEQFVEKVYFDKFEIRVE